MNGFLFSIRNIIDKKEAQLSRLLAKTITNKQIYARKLYNANTHVHELRYRISLRNYLRTKYIHHDRFVLYGEVHRIYKINIITTFQINATSNKVFTELLLYYMCHNKLRCIPISLIDLFDSSDIDIMTIPAKHSDTNQTTSMCQNRTIANTGDWKYPHEKQAPPSGWHIRDGSIINDVSVKYPDLITRLSEDN